MFYASLIEALFIYIYNQYIKPGNLHTLQKAAIEQYENVQQTLAASGSFERFMPRLKEAIEALKEAPVLTPIETAMTTLSNNLTEAIRDLYQRQTRLQLLRKGGDLELEGSIVGYDLTQGAISVDSYASESKLTIRVKVHFTNNINPEDSFDKTYSAYQTFDASRLLTDVQDELCDIMIKEIAENIYNDTVARW